MRFFISSFVLFIAVSSNAATSAAPVAGVNPVTVNNTGTVGVGTTPGSAVGSEGAPTGPNLGPTAPLAGGGNLQLPATPNQLPGVAPTNNPVPGTLPTSEIDNPATTTFNNPGNNTGINQNNPTVNQLSGNPTLYNPGLPENSLNPPTQ